MGELRRTQPFTRDFGASRGLPICRYYIENFLNTYYADIQGHVLEIGDNRYTKKFGGKRVKQSDVLHALEGNPQATIVGDLSTGKNLPSGTFDCIILTQTLLAIFDLPAVVNTLHHILKPEGVVLITTPGVSQISRYDMERWGDYWRLTDLSAKNLFEPVFGKDSVKIETYGNVLSCVAYLMGLSSRDLSPPELAVMDPDYQLIVTVRAQKNL
jgi:SAM-dependent methyltransferase